MPCSILSSAFSSHYYLLRISLHFSDILFFSFLLKHQMCYVLILCVSGYIDLRNRQPFKCRLRLFLTADFYRYGNFKNIDSKHFNYIYTAGKQNRSNFRAFSLKLC